MTTYQISTNATVSTAAIPNDNTQTQLLALNSNNSVGYRNASSFGTANQTLNTTSNVTFNNMTTYQISATANNAINMLTQYVTWSSAYLTTTNATFTTIYTLATATNTAYILVAEVCAYDATNSGGACFLYVERISNNSGTLTLGSMEALNNKSATGNITSAKIQIIASGTNVLVQVAGAATDTVYWTAIIRITYTS